MAETPKDSLLPISVDEADELARIMTGNRMNVMKTPSGTIYLTHLGKRHRVHLLAYQMTRRGIAAAVAENEPWRGE